MADTHLQSRPRRVLAIASGGGHWVQLMRLRPAFIGAEVTYATVDAAMAAEVSPSRLFTYPEANKERPLRLIASALCIARIVWSVRPDVVISTGAAGGVFAIAIARLFGAKTMFIDSLANAQQLSLSARLARPIAHRVLSQWPSVAETSGTEFCGAVL